MASIDDVKLAAGCLSTVFPQFVAKELAALTDEIATAVQGFTDPLAALGDLNVDSLIADVAALSEGDIYSNLGSAAVGIGAQLVRREASDILGAMAAEYPSVTKRVHATRNLSSVVVANGSSMLALLSDMPYAAGQKMCEVIIELDDLKTKNLECLRKHIVQLVNAVLVLAKSVTTYKDETFEDLDAVAALLVQVKANLVLSQRVKAGEVHFDFQAFERARQQLTDASSLLTPDKDGTSLLDATDILLYGSVTTANVTRGNRKLVTLVIPSLIQLIEVEISAVVTQVQVINYYVGKLGEVIGSYRRSGQASKVAEQRSRAIREIQTRLANLAERIDLARSRQALSAASGEMLLWSARVKTILATMDRVRLLTLQEGSVEGPDKAYQLEQAFQALLTGLTAIENDETTAGIENPLLLRDRVLALTKGARRIVKDLENGRTTENRLATFHLEAVTTATAQTSRIQRSITVAKRQKALCESFAAIDLKTSAKLEDLQESLRRLGLDRGVDLLTTGGFEEFLSADLEDLSYLGIAIKCLGHGIKGTDDAQTRQQIGKIRDGLIAQRSNMDIAAADGADQGRTRTLKKLKGKVASIQKNAKTVESIVSELKTILLAAGEAVEQTFDQLQALNGFAANIDHLAVGAGGRLAAGLEEFSDHPNAGVVLCD